MAQQQISVAQTDEGWKRPGFTTNTVLNHLFKQSVGRTNTSLDRPYYLEDAARSAVYRDKIATDKVPSAPPEDFVALTNTQIKSTFGITDAEIEGFYSYHDGANIFAIEQSISYPYIYRIKHLRMAPAPANPTSTFQGLTPTTKVNMLAASIPFNMGTGAYKPTLYRTDLSGALAQGGRDIIYAQQLAYTFDAESGVFIMHAADTTPYTRNPISAVTPPVITCYIYRGQYGRLGWSYIPEDTLALDEMRLLVGKRTIDDPSLVMDVSGSAFITDITAHSFSTSSDLRLKRDVRPAPAIPGVLDLQPRYYQYNSSPADSPHEYGLIAQEVEAILPEAVRTNGDGFKSVLYDRLGVALLPVVKAQESRIAALERENAEIKAAVNRLLEVLPAARS
jgi:hypothetical protein